MKSPFENYDAFWGRLSSRSYFVNSLNRKLNKHTKHVCRHSFLPDLEEHLIYKDEDNSEDGWIEE